MMWYIWYIWCDTYVPIMMDTICYPIMLWYVAQGFQNVCAEYSQSKQAREPLRLSLFKFWKANYKDTEWEAEGIQNPIVLLISCNYQPQPH